MDLICKSRRYGLYRYAVTSLTTSRLIIEENRVFIANPQIKCEFIVVILYSLICRAYETELIATEFFMQACTNLSVF